MTSIETQAQNCLLSRTNLCRYLLLRQCGCDFCNAWWISSSISSTPSSLAFFSASFSKPLPATMSAHEFVLAEFEDAMHKAQLNFCLQELAAKTLFEPVSGCTRSFHATTQLQLTTPICLALFHLTILYLLDKALLQGQ